MKNLEKDLKLSGISSLSEIIINQIDKDENSIKNTIQHNTVLKEIENMRFKEPNVEKNKLFLSMDKIFEQFERIIVENPILEISLLRKNLEKDSEFREIDNLESILLDLHKLGKIVYYNKENLAGYIVSDPKWLNSVFTNILNYGRKKICFIIEDIHDQLFEEKKKNQTLPHEKDEILYLAVFILFNTKKSNLRNYKMRTIWEKYKEKSIVEKTGFQKLLNRLKLIEKKLENTNNNYILEKYKDKNENKLSLSDIIYTINEEEFQESILKQVLTEELFQDTEKKKFFVQFFEKLGIIFPKKNEGYTQKYFLPFLFPEHASRTTLMKNEKKKIDQLKTDHQWEIKYFFPFTTLSIWKLVFLLIRKESIVNERFQTVLEEYYWRDGFILEYKDTSKKNKRRHSIIVIETKISNKIEKEVEEKSIEGNNFLKDIEPIGMIEIKIRSNQKPKILLEKIDKTVKKFIERWINESFYEQIKFCVEKKSTGDIQKLQFNNGNEGGLKILCAQCFHPIFIEYNTKECQLCFSKHFLIADEFSILKLVSHGKFGRILKCLHLKTTQIVAIKERRDENMRDWEHEISMMKLIEKEEPNFLFPKVISVLDDQESNSSEKYIVMEWAEGKNMNGFNQNSLKHHYFDQEINFVEMFIQFLIQLKLLHDKKIVHGDIKPENMMFYEDDEKVLFFFVDFGSSFRIGFQENSKKSFLSLYSSPESSDSSPFYKKENFGTQSDVYSLSKSLFSILLSSQIKISVALKNLLNEMCIVNPKERISVDETLKKISSIFEDVFLKTQKERFINFHFCDKYKDLKKLFEISHPQSKKVEKGLEKANLLDTIKQKEKMVEELQKEIEIMKKKITN